ncbi:MAG: hypothetical protein SFU98_01165 [Leptospiraceae bacterium]|nr:hypothetical protein [Leptospiraceae bacterium]
MQENIYLPDKKKFHKRILWKYIILLLVNSSLLFGNYFLNNYGDNNYLLLCYFLIFVFGLLFFQNYKRQMKVISGLSLEIKDGKLIQNEASGRCEELILKDTSSLKTDSILGMNRIFLTGNDGKQRTYADIEKLNEFKEKLSQETGLTITQIQRSYGLILFKIFLIYLPSLLVYIGTKFEKTKITIPVFYLVVIINSIFFFNSISESKLEGGISNSITRRIIVILILIFFFQFYRVFTEM